MKKNLKKAKKFKCKKEADMKKDNKDEIIEIFRERAKVNREKFDASVKRLTQINKQIRMLFGSPDIEMINGNRRRSKP